MNRIYSDFDLALCNVEKYMLSKEEDIYLCQCRYPSGVEYSFREEKYVPFRDSDSIVKVCSLPIWHMFRKRGNALRAKKKFEQQHKRKLKIHRIAYNKEYVYTLKYVQ